MHSELVHLDSRIIDTQCAAGIKMLVKIILNRESQIVTSSIINRVRYHSTKKLENQILEQCTLGTLKVYSDTSRSTQSDNLAQLDGFLRSFIKIIN